MRQLSSLIVLGALVAACSGSSGDDGGNGPPITVLFSQDLVPIFQVDCLRCHGAGMAGGLDLLTHQGLMQGGQSGAVVIPFDPDNSLIIGRLEGTAPGLRMPRDGPPYLTQPEIDRVAQWIREGALDN
ncbi:MAG: c-type cytochrome domain-containing protein [Planctomycetota bacterium]|jgi:hypothetical protein